MKLVLAFVFACLPLLAGAQEKLPKDVAKFVEHAQTCEHFAGEWDDNDKARQREIIAAVDDACGQAQRQWKRLSAKYAGQPKLQKLIDEQANDAVRSYRKPG
ncbi:hypothetical protein [Janthinobacterium sp. Ant5-2-1]|uniref:hypothetical protein n=1 Tax=Janthinobacterium sp. Ant5-2-1 TaxID=1755239 RepID=UPI000717ED5E|nr:hypothetical protein [Janthinobacterium sp. Ant5-2-1]